MDVDPTPPVEPVELLPDLPPALPAPTVSRPARKKKGKSSKTTSNSKETEEDIYEDDLGGIFGETGEEESVYGTEEGGAEEINSSGPPIVIGGVDGYYLQNYDENDGEASINKTVQKGSRRSQRVESHEGNRHVLSLHFD